MQKILLSLLLLAGLPGSLAQHDLERKAFVFPTASNTAHVVLNARAHGPLNSFTLCMRFYTDLTREYSLFSYASQRSANEFLLYRERPNQYGLYLTTESVIFNIPVELRNFLGKEHVCVSWESSTGLVELWVNGYPLVWKSLKKGHSVNTQASIILGQEQDSFGGGFDINQSFTGEITDVYMWDRVLSPNEVTQVWNNAGVPGNLINWKSLRHNIKGDVFVKPALSSFPRVG